MYDFIEYCLSTFHFLEKFPRDQFETKCNKCLEREQSAFRVVDHLIAPITSEVEIQAIEHAADRGDRFSPVATHIRRSLELLSDRKAPDYRNSIKESISAVESICLIIANDPKATLGDALKKLAAHGVKVHPALLVAFNKMYGYASDADGIRHSLLDEANVDFEDAKFMLVSCSAFVNLLRARAPS